MSDDDDTAIWPANPPARPEHYTRQEAQALFEQIARDERMSFHGMNNCHMRCELSLLGALDRDDAKPAALGRALVVAEETSPRRRAVLQGEHRLYRELTRAKLLKEKPDATAADLEQAYADPKNRVRFPWSWHQAPTVEVMDDVTGKPETLVLDPATRPDGPVTLAQWLAATRPDGPANLYRARLGKNFEIDPALMSDAQIQSAARALDVIGVKLPPGPQRGQVEAAVNALAAPHERDAFVEAYTPARTVRKREGYLPDDHAQSNPRYMGLRYYGGGRDMDALKPEQRKEEERRFADFMRDDVRMAGFLQQAIDDYSGRKGDWRSHFRPGGESAQDSRGAGRSRGGGGRQ